MIKVQLSLAVMEDLKIKGFKSIIIFEAANPAELKANPNVRLFAS